MDGANESGVLNWGEVMGGNSNVREGGVPGGVVDSASEVLIQKKKEIKALRPTHTLKARHSDD